MKKSHLLLIMVWATLCGCGKDTFYDKFVPEILYFQKNDVENADFKEITLPAGTTEWTTKARVSAPMKLKEIRLFKVTGANNEELLQTYSDFQLSPNVYKLNFLIEGISAETIVKIVATDMKNKATTRNFTIKVAP